MLPKSIEHACIILPIRKISYLRMIFQNLKQKKCEVKQELSIAFANHCECVILLTSTKPPRLIAQIRHEFSIEFFKQCTTETTILVSIRYQNRNPNWQILLADTIGSLHKLLLHFLAFDHVRTPLVCTFYVVNLAFFLTIYQTPKCKVWF